MWVFYFLLSFSFLQVDYSNDLENSSISMLLKEEFALFLIYFLTLSKDRLEEVSENLFEE